MPRIRYLKPEFFTDEDLGELPFQTRLTYQGLWCHADKEGRLEDRPKFLKAMIFPYDDVDIEIELELLSKFKGNNTPFIQRYQNGDGKYIQIIQWHKHQKPHHTEKESVFPPPENPPQTPPKIKRKIKGMEKQLKASTELRNGSLTVKAQLKESFEIFYANYPKKKARDDAERAFTKLNPDKDLQDKILKAVRQAKTSKDWLKDDGEYIPHPATYLNKRRWEDEIEKGGIISPPSQRMWADIKKEKEKE